MGDGPVRSSIAEWSIRSSLHCPPHRHNAEIGGSALLLVEGQLDLPVDKLKAGLEGFPRFRAKPLKASGPSFTNERFGGSPGNSLSSDVSPDCERTSFAPATATERFRLLYHGASAQRAGA